MRSGSSLAEMSVALGIFAMAALVAAQGIFTGLKSYGQLERLEAKVEKRAFIEIAVRQKVEAAARQASNPTQRYKLLRSSQSTLKFSGVTDDTIAPGSSEEVTIALKHSASGAILEYTIKKTPPCMKKACTPDRNHVSKQAFALQGMSPYFRYFRAENSDGSQNAELKIGWQDSWDASTGWPDLIAIGDERASRGALIMRTSH